MRRSAKLALARAQPESPIKGYDQPQYRQFHTYLTYYQRFYDINHSTYKYKLELLKESPKDDNECIEIFNNFNIFFKDLPPLKIKAHNVIVQKKNGQLSFTIPLHTIREQYLGLILLISQIDEKYKLMDFEPTLFNMKFRCCYRNASFDNMEKSHGIDYLSPDRVFGVASKKGSCERGTLPYYITLVNNYLDPNSEEDLSIKDYIKKIQTSGEQQMLDQRLVFRGVNNGPARNTLFSLYKDDRLFDFKDPFYVDPEKSSCNVLRKGRRESNDNYLSLLDFPKYKYILDVNGMDGHAGRRFWLYHMNRVLFLPIDDPHKLFFETWDDPPVPDVHFVSFRKADLGKTLELENKLKWLESNPDDYERIRTNCQEYAKRRLNYESLELFVKNSLESNYETKRIL